MIGTLFADKYRVLRLLGEGAMGEVYHARHEALGKDVALKVLAEDLGTSAINQARFVREAQTCARVRHAGIVGVHDVGQWEGRPYLIMDLLQGETMRAALDSHRRFSWERTLSLSAQLADALVAAHAEGLVHRDLKPDNVMLEAGEVGQRAIILDFGLAFAQHEPAARLTEHGAVVGTPHYLSPEQAQGDAIGTAADIYSLGCVIMEMLTGLPPFPGEGYAVLLAQHMFVEPPRLSERLAEAGEAARDEATRRVWLGLDAMLVAMLAKAPALRPSAVEVHAALIDLATGGAGVARTRLPRSRMSRQVDALDPTSVDAPVTAVDVGVAAACMPEPQMWAAWQGAAAMAGLRLRSFPSDAVVELAVACVADVRDSTFRPVVVLAATDDLDAAMAQLRLGAAEVIPPGQAPADIMRKLRRVADAARRRNRR